MVLFVAHVPYCQILIIPAFLRPTPSSRLAKQLRINIYTLDALTFVQWKSPKVGHQQGIWVPQDIQRYPSSVRVSCRWSTLRYSEPVLPLRRLEEEGENRGSRWIVMRGM